MFPNLRLMIVAVLASILGISCALGLFAEFRVSHNSFLRESNASTPLQLGVSDAAAGRVVTTAAPFEFRFQAPVPLPPPPAGEAAGGAETSDHATVVKAPQPAQPVATAQPVAAPSSDSDTAAAPTAAAPTAAAPSSATAPDIISATEPAAVAASSERGAGASSTAAPSPTTTGSIADENSQPETPADSGQNAKPEAEGDLATRPPAAPSTGTTKSPSPSETGSIAKENSQPETPADSAQNTKPEAEGDVAVRTPAAASPVETPVPNAEIAPARARAAVPENRLRTLRHRPVIVRRVQRTRPAASIPDFTAVQSPFQWTPQSAYQSPQPVRRRMIRRVRPARRPVRQSAAPQTTVSYTAPADTPE